MALGFGGALVGACARPWGPLRPAPVPGPYTPPQPDLSALRVAYGPAPQQFADLRLPQGSGPYPVVIVVHGDFWRADHGLERTRPVCDALRAEGIATWNVEYRRIGEPGGGWPGTFLDLADATDHLRQLAPQHQLDLGRVVALGHSAGGQLSLWLAGRRWIRDGELVDPDPLRLQGAVSLAGLVDLARAWALGFEVVGQVMGGTPDDVPSRYGSASPAELLPLGVPQVLVHGSDDRVVPAELSRDYYAAALRRGDEVRLVTLPGVGHDELIDPASRAWPAVSDAVISLL